MFLLYFIFYTKLEYYFVGYLCTTILKATTEILFFYALLKFSFFFYFILFKFLLLLLLDMIFFINLKIIIIKLFVFIFYFFIYCFFVYIFIAKYTFYKTSLDEKLFIQNWYIYLRKGNEVFLKKKGFNILTSLEFNKFFKDYIPFFFSLNKFENSQINSKKKNLFFKQIKINKKYSSEKDQVFIKTEDVLEFERMREGIREQLFKNLFFKRNKRVKFYSYNFFVYNLYRQRDKVNYKLHQLKKENYYKKRFGLNVYNELKKITDHKQANIIRIKTSSENDFFEVKSSSNKEQK